MKNAFRLFLHDLKNIKRAPSFIILLIGLSILPSFYAWFNLRSSWDPYSNTKHLQVAIINEDNGAKIRGKSINVGKQLTQTLKHNDKFNWQFTNDMKAADHKLRMGEYYAIIHIPSNFSEDMTSIFHKKPKRAHIDYKVNQKINAIAPKMTTAGATAITESLSEKFIASATASLLQESNRVGVSIENKIPLYHKIENAVFDAERAIPDMERFRDAVIKIDEHQGDISKYADEFYALSNYRDKLNGGASKIIEANQHASDIKAVGELIVKVNNNLPEIQSALQKANTIEEKFPEINAAVSKGIQATETAQSVLNTSQSAMPKVHDKISKAQDMNQKGKAQLSKVDIQPAYTALHDGLSAMSKLSGEEALATLDTLDKLNTLAQSYPGGSEQLAQNLKIYQNNIQQTIRFNNEMIRIMKEVASLGIDTALITDKFQEVNSKLNLLNEALSVSITQATKKERVTIDTDKIAAAQAALKSLSDFTNTTMLERLETGLTTLNGGLDVIAEKLNTASDFASKVDTILGDAMRITQEANQTLNTINQQLPAFENRFSQVNQIAQANYPKFAAKIGKASQFVQSDLGNVLTDLNKLSNFAENDLPGVLKKYDKTSQLLQNKLPGAQSGIHELAQFARNDLPGIEQDIKKAAQKLRDFDDKDALNKLVKLLRNDLKDESDYFAKPIQLDETQIFPIPNYGSASAPFYTALALWVGALLCGNLLTTELKDQSIKDKFSLRELYLGRMILFLLISVAQAIIVVLGNLFILDAYAKHPIYNVLFAILVGLAFTVIVYTLVSLLGNIGKALAIIIMVLQIAGGGGTFPIQVTPLFFQHIHPFLPFTYAVDLLREAVGGITPELVWTKLGFLYLITAIIFAIGVILKPKFEPIKKGFYARSQASNLVE
ncbi:YhgE/Pip domain-containing protein [Macrococcus capreoli]|uniref:YhgE/Pip domain-containing protein n=1 Tax=Macrococcus capreoli TaxID=2982690 RepID=UPI0021D59D2A|nr:YhgE/Pip domain-containing protein [Macrococcus sp. TMW 2.2395]MCU7556948.1 YhgE/Pip domain-containing protein [Macrococcus sp. TMW 2.2395]